jgi:TonB family protein
LNKRITIPFLCALATLSNNTHISAYEFPPRDEARFAGALASIDDSELRNHQGYQKWKKALMETQSGLALLAKWDDRALTVHIAMGENSGGPAGATTTDFIFDRGKLISAKIVLGKDLAKRAPLNVADYPVLSSLSDDGHNVNREVRGLAFLAHEFGHVEFARMGGVAFQRQNQLLREHNAGYANFGFDWFKRPEYRRLVAELGVAPLELRRQREVGADAFAIPVIQDYFGGKMPATVRQAIQRYREAYPLSFTVAETQRRFASDLDAELPKVSFADWFERVVGQGAGIVWQLSECGERGEDSLNATGDIRACVEANAMLPDGRRVILMTAVGTFKKGVVGAPRFDFGVIEQRGGELFSVRRLRDLPGQLSNPNRLTLTREQLVKLPDLHFPEVRLAAAAPPAVWSEGDFGQVSISEAEDLSPPPAPLRLKPAGEITEKLKVLGAVSWGGVISKAQPRYPPSAKKYNISGPVDVEVTISEAGRVTEAKAVSGHPLLRGAAEEAARQWVFRPATLKGVPVQTQIVLTFVFKAPQ